MIFSSLPAPANLLYALVVFTVFSLGRLGRNITNQNAAVSTSIGEHDPMMMPTMQQFKSSSRSQRRYPPRITSLFSRKMPERPPTKPRRTVSTYAEQQDTRGNIEKEVPCTQSTRHQATAYPTCNNMHELDMNSKGITVSSGNDRHGDGLIRWKRIRRDVKNIETTIKSLSWDQSYNISVFDRRRMDAIISERLTSSRRITDIYNYCGTSTMQAFAATSQSISSISDLSMYSAEKKLSIAKSMVRALVEIQKASTGDNSTIIHGDLSPDCFSIVKGKAVLSSFDSARFVVKQQNKSTKDIRTTCTRTFGNNRNLPYLPREQLIGHMNLTEATDVYSLGLLVYYVLTGIHPFADKSPLIDLIEPAQTSDSLSSSSVRDKIINGSLPRIPDVDLNAKDPSIRAMVEVVKVSARKYPEDRPSTREILSLLKDSNSLFCDQKPLFKSSETYNALEEYFNETTVEECMENDIFKWRVVVSANMAYEEDFLNWWAHCSDSRLFDDRTRVILYAEDEEMYNTYAKSTKMEVKKSWEVGTKWNDTSLTGGGRFSYSETKGFGQMMGRRGGILVDEMKIAKDEGERVLFMDLDVMLLSDPRLFFCGEYDLWGQDASSYRTGPFNGGLLAMRPVSRMIATVEMWRDVLESREEAGSNQKAFNDAVRHVAKEKGLKSKLLPSQLFPVGRYANNKHVKACLGPSVIHGAEHIVAFHNNWCSEARKCHKTDRARKLGLWKPVDREVVL